MIGYENVTCGIYVIRNKKIIKIQQRIVKR